MGSYFGWRSLAVWGNIVGDSIDQTETETVEHWAHHVLSVIYLLDKLRRGQQTILLCWQAQIG